MPEVSVEDCQALTAAWMGTELEEVAYIDQTLLDADNEDVAEAEDEDAEGEEIGGVRLNSLYYNRPAVLTVNRVRYVFYFRDCNSAPRYRIPLSRVFRTFEAGSCISFRKYKMFYT